MTLNEEKEIKMNFEERSEEDELSVKGDESPLCVTPFSECKFTPKNLKQASITPIQFKSK